MTTHAALTRNARRLAAKAASAKHRARTRSARSTPPKFAPSPAVANPLRLDPSRTGALRVKAAAAVRARYDRLRTAVYRAVVLEDALGLRQLTANYDPRQPRDDHGRFAEVRGSGVRSEIVARIKAMPDAAESHEWTRDRSTREIPNLFQTVPQKQRDAAFKDILKWAKSDQTEMTEFTFSPAQLARMVTPQPNLKEANLVKWVEADKVPGGADAFLHEGTVYLRDANHRAAAAVLRGESYTVRLVHRKDSGFSPDHLTRNADGANCGIGASGFLPGNTCARGGGNGAVHVSDAERKAIDDAVAAASDVAGYRLSIRGVRIEPGKSESTGFGYTNGWVIVTPNALAAAREHDPTKSVRDYGGGPRSLSVEHARDSLEYLRIGVAHEMGHHAEAALGLDLQAAYRASPYRPENAERVSGFSTTHQVELFAETHALLSTGRHDLIPADVLTWYRTALGTATQPLPVFVKNRSNPIDPWPWVGNAFFGVGPADRLTQFGRWLASSAATLWQDLEETLRGITQLAIRRGAGRAFDEVRAGHFIDPNFRPAARDQFLHGILGRRENQDRFGVLEKRITDESVNHRDSVVEKIERSIADSVGQGKSPQDAWKEISTTINRERDSAVTTVNDEVVRGHAEGQIAGYGEAGVTELFPLLEWTVHPDASKAGVCPRCRAMKGTVWTITDARGKIPLHRNCKCSWSARDPEAGPNRRAPSPAPTYYLPGAGAKFRGTP